MPGRKSILPLLIVLSVTLVLGVTYVGYKKTLNWLLVKDANALGMNWAHHVESHLPGLLGNDSSGDAVVAQTTPDPEELARIAFDLLSIKNIHQIDFVNASAQCVASFGSFLTPLPRATVSAWTGNGNRKSASDMPLNAALPLNLPGGSLDDHVVADGAAHGSVSAQPGSQWRLPLDHNGIRPIIEKGHKEIIVRRDTPAHQPDVFAEIYYPILKDGKAEYFLRILMDLEARQALYQNLFLTGTLVLLSLVALFFVYPAKQFVLIHRSKTEADRKARFHATHDLMTGLLNRNAFQADASGMLADCGSRQEEALLFLVDIDGFKGINDFYGHDAGDQLLKQVAVQLESHCPTGSLIARIGGDEFAILVCSKDMTAGTNADCLNIPRTFDVNLNQRIQTLSITIAAGMARFPRDGTHLQELMLNADLAWHSAKKSSDRRLCEFDAGLRQQFQSRINLLRDFSRALDTSQIVPYYQPLICTATGRVRGFEALARWQHPTRGVLTPAFFHEALEDSEIARALGTYMLASITADMAAWKSQDIPFQTVGMNVTDADLRRSGFSLDVIAELSRHGLAGHELAIEITENCVFASNKAVIIGRLEELRSAGCHVALDDFGTGYSSITHIKDMPVSAVKIDKSFIREIANNKADQAIVRALVDLGASIGFQLVAEGVETAQQRDLVQSLGCHLIQGFYYAKPVPASEVPGLLSRINPAEVRAAG